MKTAEETLKEKIRFLQLYLFMELTKLFVDAILL